MKFSRGTKLITVSIPVTQEVHDRLTKYAELKSMEYGIVVTMADIGRKAIDEYLERHEQEAQP